MPFRNCGAIALAVALMATPIPAQDRVADARQAKEAGLRRDFAAAGLTYPPASLYIRALKRERRLEIWVGTKSGRMKRFRAYDIRAMSGSLGPKLREGDFQAPEGFYTVNRFNPRSNFLLSLGLDYPNRRDRVRGEERPGGDIFIHGNQVSIGCLAMGDEAIQEIYLMAIGAKKKPIPVHVFPGHMDAVRWPALQAEASPELRRFWATLRPGYLQFERTRRVPRTSVRDGEYIVHPAR